MDNQSIVLELQNQARVLARDRVNMFRIKAYRRSAEVIWRLSTPVSEMTLQDLKNLPGLGTHLSLAIYQYSRTGQWLSYDEIKEHGLAV